MTPNKKAPERVWVAHWHAYKEKAVAETVNRDEHYEYIRADLYDALKAKVLALECAGKCWGKSGTIDLRCDVCKLKEEVRRG